MKPYYKVPPPQVPFPFSVPSHLPLLIFIFHCFSLSLSLLLSPLFFSSSISLTCTLVTYPLFSFYSYILLIFIPSSSSPPILSSSPLLSSSTVCHSPYPSLFSFPYLLTILLRSLSSLLIIFFSFFLFLSSLSALPFLFLFRLPLPLLFSSCFVGTMLSSFSRSLCSGMKKRYEET